MLLDKNLCLTVHQSHNCGLGGMRHDAFMGKILGSQTVDGYVLMAGEKV